MSNVSLEKYNTFALPVNAERLVFADHIEQVIDTWKETQEHQKPFLMLGEGSNVLFLEDFAGTVVINQFKGIKITEDKEFWYLHVGSGEKWHDLVCHTLNLGIAGLENLALIPGLVGTAPIQNIGAYGVELKNFCSYVDLLNLNTGSAERIIASKCQFGYRESIFKHQFRLGYAIVSVGFQLTKKWTPTLDYGDLAKIDPKTAFPRQVFESVCAVRRSKLPDPQTLGNAGSFFKNPIVSVEKGAELIAKYPIMPHYWHNDSEVKLAAGWLIDRCRLKGFQIGGAAVHHQQALVLVNVNNALSKDVIALARYVRNKVVEQFGVCLEPEVRFIGSMGEQNAEEILS